MIFHFCFKYYFQTYIFGIFFLKIQNKLNYTLCSSQFFFIFIHLFMFNNALNCLLIMVFESCVLSLLYIVVTFLFLAHLSTKCSSELLWWPIDVVHRPCVNNFFKQHLLWNHLMDFDQTSQEWSLGGPLSNFKPFQLVA